MACMFLFCYFKESGERVCGQDWPEPSHFTFSTPLSCPAKVAHLCQCLTLATRFFRLLCVWKRETVQNYRMCARGDKLSFNLVNFIISSLYVCSKRMHSGHIGHIFSFLFTINALLPSTPKHVELFRHRKMYLSRLIHISEIKSLSPHKTIFAVFGVLIFAGQSQAHERNIWF